MKVVRFPLQALSRFHFGLLKLDDNLALSSTGLYAHSDTLFSSLMHAYASCEGEAESFAALFAEDRLLISSLFYYLKADSSSAGNQCIYFLPKPCFLDAQNLKEKGGRHKLSNRVRFVSQGVWIAGFEAEKWDVNNPEAPYRIWSDYFVLTAGEAESLGLDERHDFVSLVSSPKSPIRAHANAAIFYQTDVLVDVPRSLEGGLYFIFEAADEEAELSLRKAVNVMVYSGIGGERYNTGRSFKEEAPVWDEWIPELTSVGDTHFSSISLFNPSNDDEFKTLQSYRTLLRGGRRIDEKSYAQVVRMVEEGALLSSSDVKGRLVSLGEDQNGCDIWRNGKTLLIPVQYEK